MNILNNSLCERMFKLCVIRFSIDIHIICSKTNLANPRQIFSFFSISQMSLWFFFLLYYGFIMSKLIISLKTKSFILRTTRFIYRKNMFFREHASSHSHFLSKPFRKYITIKKVDDVTNWFVSWKYNKQPYFQTHLSR